MNSVSQENQLSALNCILLEEYKKKKKNMKKVIKIIPSLRATHFWGEIESQTQTKNSVNSSIFIDRSSNEQIFWFKYEKQTQSRPRIEGYKKQQINQLFGCLSRFCDTFLPLYLNKHSVYRLDHAVKRMFTRKLLADELLARAIYLQMVLGGWTYFSPRNRKRKFRFQQKMEEGRWQTDRTPKKMFRVSPWGQLDEVTVSFQVTNWVFCNSIWMFHAMI